MSVVEADAGGADSIRVNGSTPSRLLQFGPERRLVGILSGPADAAGPVLVLPNAGLVPRAGPSRLHVELAQRLARVGMRSFRFDTPGVGEAPRLAQCSAHDATLAALDALQQAYGATTFVVGGVCSAADLGWSAANADRRVIGMLMLDGLSFTGPWYQWAKMMGALRRGPAAWAGIAGRLFARTATAAVGPSRPSIGEYRDWPDKQTAQRRLAELVERDVRSLWIYTGGFGDLFLHPRQFADNFGAAARDHRTSMHHWPDVDHTFFARAHRERLLKTIEDWMLQWRSTTPVP